MIKAKRLGHATFETPDLERAVDYYTTVIGLRVAGREAGRVFLASRMGLLTIALEKGERERCSKLALEISKDITPAEGQKLLTSVGVGASVATDPHPGVSRILTFKDPKDTTIELFNEWSFMEAEAPKADAVAPYKLGHIAFYCESPQRMVEFYSKVLGCRLSDWVGDYFAFMRCGIDHHTVNFLRGPVRQMQHMAFELRDQSQLVAACDVLGRQGKPLLWGPVRHGPGHNIACYHRNADDQIVELFCDMDVISDEELGYFDPRPWHRDKPQRPKVWSPSIMRDMWGLPPLADFHRPSGQPKA